ncbi:MAG: hypothetical protein L3K14_07750 [Thermoplasmata archaeon]|nr:hypothetical protein [Thermoplasmata archaeon]
MLGRREDQERLSPGANATRTTRIHELVRARPELLFAPLAALFLLVNVAPWGPGVIYVTTFVAWFTLQRSNPIFPVTWLSAVVLFATMQYLYLRWTRVAWWRTFLMAATLPFAGAGLFELLYELCDKLVHPGWTVSLWTVVSLGTWISLGFVGAGSWKFSTRFWALFGGILLGFGIWSAIGFPVIDLGTATQVAWAYAFNLPLKVACFIVVGLPPLEGFLQFRNQRRTPTPSSEASGNKA